MSKKTVGTYEVVTTLLGTINELQSFLPVDFTPLLDNTFNFKYNVARDILPVNKPKVKYFSIGIGGVRNVDSTNLRAIQSPKVQNANLYVPIPFRMVPVDEDLNEIERQIYRGRVLETHNGLEYWAWYLKMIQFTDTQVQITRTDPVTGNEQSYELDNTNLNPTPPTPNPSGSTGADTKINVTVSGNLEILGKEVLESVNIIYDDPHRAIVSEIGVWTGEDKIITANDGVGGTLEYTEAIYTMLHSHYCNLGTDMSSPDTNWRRKLRLGKGNLIMV